MIIKTTSVGKIKFCKIEVRCDLAVTAPAPSQQPHISSLMSE